MSTRLCKIEKKNGLRVVRSSNFPKEWQQSCNITSRFLGMVLRLFGFGGTEGVRYMYLNRINTLTFVKTLYDSSNI